MILKNELESCGRKQLWPNLRYYGGTYMEKLIGGRNSGKIVCVLAESQIWHLPNTREKNYCSSEPAQ
jgi:hypothetical protein